jgi:SAM-dependent methyltransferase
MQNPGTMNAEALGNRGLEELARVPARGAVLTGPYESGILALRDAILAGDRRSEVILGFIDAFVRLTGIPDTWDIGPAVGLCIESQRISPSAAVRPAILALRQDTTIAAAFAAAGKGDGTEVENLLKTGQLLKSLAHPLFQLLLRSTVVAGPNLEFVLTTARRFLLENVSLLTIDASHRALSSALATQCFLNEYAFHAEAGERSRVLALAAEVETRLNAGETVDPFQVALLACYAPLSDYSWITRLDASSQVLAPLIAQQVTAPALERRLESEIESLSSLRDPTSLKVQALYEENPYPRWVVPLRKEVMPDREVFARKYPGADLRMLSQIEAPEILVAGCGTGLNIFTAVAGHASWNLTAVDLSRRSLAHAMRHVREEKLANVRILQADILDLGALPGTFDIIESIGVLHHLADPLKGWRILADKLRPGGVMQVALYSASGRRSLEGIRRYAAARGFGPARESLLAFRHHVLKISRERDHPDAAVLRDVSLLDAHDFYSVSTCRDLLFHPQETLFTLPMVKQIIAELGLRSAGLALPSPAYLADYRTRYPDDPHGTELDNWHQVESRNPAMFAGMYFLTLQKPLGHAA